MTEKTAVFRIVWKIPRKSRLETRINSTKNSGEGRNEFPDVKGIDTNHSMPPQSIRSRRNEFPDVKGIDTRVLRLELHYYFCRNEFPDVKGIDTFATAVSTASAATGRNEFPDVKGIDTAMQPGSSLSTMVEMSSPM